ncbi:MAG TPA: exodeoxyribonuclease VII large subunit [Candidatus Binatia bacterium]
MTTVKAFDALLFGAPERSFLSVSELNEIVKETLESQLAAVWVAGEISNLRIPPSGHFYFTLKDEKSQVAAVMFRRQGFGLRFAPENGMAVLCFGRVGLYPVRGDLQLYVESMEPRGQGALYLAFEQLKKRLAAEGLFAEERKRPLPFLPASIGIVTSDKGAALYDMLRVIGDRYPDRRIVIRPVKVQGEGAAKEIADGIDDLNSFGAVDVMIVGRGGGSLEDLWAFNEEDVARAIFASTAPVIAAVGHEIDFTIADFVADRRAPTPTAAAEMVVPKKIDLLEHLASTDEALRRGMARKIESARDDWRDMVNRLSDPGRNLREHQQRLDELSIDLVRRFHDRLRQWRDELGRVSGRLEALSPLAVLQRGYSIAHKLPEERIVKDVVTLTAGDRLRITFAAGKAICRVEDTE